MCILYNDNAARESAAARGSLSAARNSVKLTLRGVARALPASETTLDVFGFFY